MLSKKLKEMRKNFGMSQEQLAEKLSVSRQAVTKWETGAGIPDIENIKAIAKLFSVSIDELLENENIKIEKTPDFLFTSSTEYDIDRKKSYDINFDGAKFVSVSSYDGEKIKVILSSNEISDIQTAFKVKIDDNRNCIDVDIKKYGEMTETVAKESLHIDFKIPEKYIVNIEVTGNSETVVVKDIVADNIEFNGKIVNFINENTDTHIELNSNLDMNIVCKTLKGKLDVNQISATSKLYVASGIEFASVTKGIANKIILNDVEINSDSENIIELNGIKSELVIGIFK